jgi:hypothetical protein
VGHISITCWLADDPGLDPGVGDAVFVVRREDLAIVASGITEFTFIHECDECEDDGAPVCEVTLRVVLASGEGLPLANIWGPHAEWSSPYSIIELNDDQEEELWTSWLSHIESLGRIPPRSDFPQHYEEMSTVSLPSGDTLLAVREEGKTGVQVWLQPKAVLRMEDTRVVCIASGLTLGEALRRMAAEVEGETPETPVTKGAR